MTIFPKLLQVAELGRTLSNSCYNVTITQKPTGEDTTKKKKYGPIPWMNKDAKILNKH